MNDEKQDELLNLAAEYFNQHILPTLQELLGEDVSKLAVYITGSVAAGFGDEYSDVDIEIYPPEALSNETRDQLENNVAEEKTFKGVRMSVGISLLSRRLDMLRDDKLTDFWKDMNPLLLWSLQNLVVLHDKDEQLKKIQEKVVFYPDDKFVEVVRGLWITISDSGEYNSKQAHVRGDKIGEDIYFYRAVEAALRLVYLLNRKYYPPTKWLSVGIKDLENDFGSLPLQENSSSNFDEKHSAFMSVFDHLGKYLVEENILEREYVDDYSLNFSKSYFIFRSF